MASWRLPRILSIRCTMPKLLTTTAVRLLLRCAAQPSARPPAAAECTEQILQIQCFKTLQLSVFVLCCVCHHCRPPPHHYQPSGALHSPPTIPGMDKIAEIDSLLVHFMLYFTSQTQIILKQPLNSSPLTLARLSPSRPKTHHLHHAELSSAPRNAGERKSYKNVLLTS